MEHVIKTVALIGAGAVGAYFIEGFCDAQDVDFFLVAEGDRKKKLTEQGISINGRQYFPTVKTPQEANAPDLILITTKYNGLDSAVAAIKQMLGDDTIILSLLNGVDSEEVIEREIGPGHVLNSVMKIISRRGEDGIFYNKAATYGFDFGDKASSEKTLQCKAVEKLFGKTEMGCHFQPDIIACEWWKYTLNIAYNLPQAVFGTGFASYFDSAHVGCIRDRLEAEVRAVAGAYGITYGPLTNTRASAAPEARFSTLQDLEAKRHTEIDMFLGVLIEKAKAVDVAVPFAEYTYHAIKALEEKNDGVIV